MNKNKNKLLFWIVLSGLVLCYFLIKFQGESWTRALYSSGAFGFLDFFTHPSQPNSPESFYTGRMVEVLFGPLSMVLSGIVLILICRRYFLGASGPVFGLLIFFYLLITKFEALTFPVYGEAGSGPVAEAIWLYRHHFDYWGLMHEDNFSMGGPKVYLFSVYPGFVALLMTICPTIKIFLAVYQLMMFAAAATVVTLFRLVVTKIYDAQKAALMAIILMSLPIFQSMGEVVNMEMLCLFFAVWSFYFLANKKVGFAVTAALCSALVKGPGGLVCAAVFVISLGLLLFDPEYRKRPWIILYSASIFAFGFFKFILLKIFVGTTQMPAGTIKFLVGAKPLSECIFLMIFLAVSIVGLIGCWWTSRLKSDSEHRPFFIRYFIPIVSLTFVIMWFCLYVNVSVMGPRYKLLVSPFLLFSVVFAVFSFIKSSRAQNALLTASVVLALAGSYGLYYPNKIQSYTYAFNELERSLEYRNDLKLCQQLVKTLDRDYPDYAVAAPFVIAQNLALPELGYVKKPRNVTIYSFHIQYGDIKNFTGLRDLDIRRTIWVGFRNDKVKVPVPYPIDPKLDLVLKELSVGDKSLTLFQGGYAIERMGLVYQHFYKQRIAVQGR